MKLSILVVVFVALACCGMLVCGQMMDPVDYEADAMLNEYDGTMESDSMDTMMAAQYEHDGTMDEAASQQYEYDPYGAQYADDESMYDDVGDASSPSSPSSPSALTDDEIAKKCTPFEKPKPLTGFNAAGLAGFWHEIAVSSLPRLISEADCYCSFMNNTLVTDATAKQQLEGRILFDLIASCNKGSATGPQVLKIGQGIQIHPTSDPASFQYFMVEAKKDAQGNLVPVQPPQQQTSAPKPQPATSAPAAPATAARRQPMQPQQPSLADSLVPNLVTLKSIGEGDQQSVIMAGPCMETLWVMSRQPTMDDVTYKALLAAATAAGIDVNKAGMIKTPQAGCATLQ